jgi:hypothetical protein
MVICAFGHLLLVIGVFMWRVSWTVSRKRANSIATRWQKRSSSSIDQLRNTWRGADKLFSAKQPEEQPEDNVDMSVTV